MRYNEIIKEDAITQAIKPFKLKWDKNINSEGETELTTTNSSGESFMIYYEPSDTEVIGWSTGTLNRAGKFISNGSGTDSVETTIEYFQKWLGNEELMASRGQRPVAQQRIRSRRLR